MHNITSYFFFSPSFSVLFGFFKRAYQTKKIGARIHFSSDTHIHNNTYTYAHRFSYTIALAFLLHLLVLSLFLCNAYTCIETAFESNETLARVYFQILTYLLTVSHLNSWIIAIGCCYFVFVFFFLKKKKG